MLATLGAEVVTLAAGAAAAAATISSTVIHDPAEPLAVAPGGLLLLVGSTVDAPQTLPDLELVRERGFAAVAVKRRGRPLEPLAAAAEAAGLALVVANDEIPWRQLDALVSSALAAGAPAGSGAHDAGGEELFPIANAIAAVVGGSVAIEDLAQHVLAYSNLEGQRIDPLRRRGILDRRVPVGPRDAELYRSVLAAEGVVRFAQHGDELPRAAMAIRAGTLPLGTVWAIEGEQGLSRQAEQAILDGAQLAALHMLRARSAFDLDRFRRGELLRALLEASRPPEDSWSRLGLTPEQPVCLVGLAPAWSPGAGGGPLLTHVAREVARLAGALRPDAAVTTAARAVYVLVSGRDVRAGAHRLAERLVQDLSRGLDGPVHAGVSSERRGPHAITSLRHEVDQVLRVSAGGMRPTPVAAFEDVRSQILLLAVADELDRRAELRQPALAELPGGPRGDLAASVLAWLESGQGVGEAAARLHVHPNTLRYRLRRFTELTGLDLDEPDQRLAVWLELRLTGREPERARDRARPR